MLESEVHLRWQTVPARQEDWKTRAILKGKAAKTVSPLSEE